MKKSLVLKTGREKALLRRHPWIFSGAVLRVEGNPFPGDTVAIRTSNGQFLAWAAYSPQSSIRARVWSWNESQIPDLQMMRERIQAAAHMRAALNIPAKTNAYRLIHAESDGLPGLIADRYADFVVIQCLTTGADAWRDVFADALMEQPGVRGVYERSDVDVRRLEGLQERVGTLRGETPPRRITIQEKSTQFLVDVISGHKTGFYIDQRENRAIVGDYSAGRDVLNCFSYTGGFSLSALAGGAKSVLSVDTSADVLDLGRENLVLNHFEERQVEWMKADVFQALRTFRDARRTFDLIILDPPKFAPTVAQVKQAARGYKDINLLAFKSLRPGGILATFSCSGGVSAELFQKIVAGAALDAGVNAQILRRMTQGPDHPVSIHFPEGDYLTGLICRI